METHRPPSADGTADSSPTGELRREHRVIERVLRVLERLVARARSGEGFERQAFGRAVEFFRLFADACHHAKEEDLLFPALEARGIPRAGGPIGVMLEEHRLAREHTRRMAAALAEAGAAAETAFLTAADDYLELLRAHIFKEDNVLFRVGEEVLTGADRQRLGAGFCDVACRDFDGRTREELEAIAEELEARWPAGASGTA